MSAAARTLIDRGDRLGRWGRPREAAAAYREACAAEPDADARYLALLGLARSLDAFGAGGAVDVCRRAIGEAPERAAGHAVLAHLLAQQGALDEAATAAAEACRSEGGAAAPHCLAATIALRRGRVGEALALAATALARDPDCQRARALQWIAEAWREPGAEAADPRRLVRVTEPAAPPAFATLAAFNEALAAAIAGNDLLATDEGGPLVGGARLHDLSDMDPVLAAAMREIFLAQARLHAAGLPDGGEPRSLSLRGWANRMEEGAFEAPHIHEGGWLSAVYYPRLPEAGSRGGEIVFGPPGLGPGVPSPAYRISPAMGMMITFPSWLYHSTLPFAGRGLRISVAADLARSDGPKAARPSHRQLVAGF